MWKENHKIKEKIEYIFLALLSYTCIHYIYYIFIIYTKNVYFMYIV